MKTWKKLLAMGLCSLMLISDTGSGVFAAATWETVEPDAAVGQKIGDFNVTEDGELISYDGSEEKVVIPDEVAVIGTLAFDGNSKIKEVVIPGTVKEIREKAFRECSGLTKVNLPEELTYIGASAFSWCTSLENVAIPSSVSFIGDHAFCGCEAFTEITIPEGVTSIEQSLLYGCKRLTKVSIPSSVKSIGDMAFEECKVLNDVVIPEEVTSLGKKAFYGCSKLSELTIPKSVDSIGCNALYNTAWLENKRAIDPLVSVNNILVDGQTVSTKQIEIPFGIKKIADEAFLECDSIEKVTIPNTVDSIGEGAFSGCWDLAEIDIPENITKFGTNAFYGTPWLGAQREKSALVIVNNVLVDGKTASGKVTIPDTVIGIADSAFSYNSDMTEVIIPDTVTQMGKDAFNACDGISTIRIPGSISSISREAFGNCYKLAEVEIGEGVTCIEDGAFQLCRALKTITFPETMKSIGEYAFHECEALTEVEIQEGVISIGEDAFGLCTKLKKIVIPESVIQMGKGCIPNMATIYGVIGSEAQKYASINHIAFVAENLPIELTEDNQVLSREQLEKLCYDSVYYDREVRIVNASGVSFTIPAGTFFLEEGLEFIDFGTELFTDYSSLENPDFNQEEFALGIRFNHSGKLPTKEKAEITIPVGTEWAGKTLYYFQVLDDGSYQSTGQSGVVAEDGTLTVEQTHCSAYVLTSKAAALRFGDINGNGKIEAEDALAILKHVVGANLIKDEILNYADVDADTNITAMDALDILKKVVGAIEKFDAETKEAVS